MTGKKFSVFILIPALTFILGIASAFGGESNFKIGDVFPAPVGKSVDVGIRMVNPTPIKNSDQEFSYGSMCMMIYGGTIEIKGVTDDGRVLIEYRIKTPTSGYDCPGSALYFKPVEEVQKYAAYYHEFVGKWRKDVEVIRQILGNK